MTDRIRETANSIVTMVLFLGSVGSAVFFGLGIGGLIASFLDYTNPPFIGFYEGGLVWLMCILAACMLGLLLGLVGSHTHGVWEEKDKNTLDMIVNFVRSSKSS